VKRGVTRCSAREIAVQRALRNMRAMDTQTTFCLAPTGACRPRRLALAALVSLMVPWVVAWAVAGTAHAADAVATAAPATATERPLDLSLPREFRARAGAASAAGDGRFDGKPYGSGYESRRMGASGEPMAAARGQGGASATHGAPNGRGAGQTTGAGRGAGRRGGR
jgi:hypothetical protein